MSEATIRALLANPIVMTLLAIVFATVITTLILIVFIMLRAIFLGQNVSTPIFKIESRLGIQAGTVELPDEKRETFFDGKYHGERTLKHTIVFEAPFKREPKIAVSLRKIDVGESDPHSAQKINRLEVYTQNIKKESFELYFKTWADSKVFNAAASWIAIGEIE